MCYDTAQLAERIYRDALRAGASKEELDYLRKNWEEKKKSKPQNKYYHVNGFQHPNLLAFQRREDRLIVDQFTWGLIPHWTKDETQAQEIWDKTLNARGETIFDKPSFQSAASSNRIVIPLDGFYEHHHKKGKTFPYFIQREDKESLLVGGLASEWKNPMTGELIRSLSIVTTKANPFMQEIHNNPKLKEARMPLLLDEEYIQDWMSGDQATAEVLIQPASVKLKAHTVRSLRGKGATGNVPEAQAPFSYAALYEPPTLF